VTTLIIINHIFWRSFCKLCRRRQVYFMITISIVRCLIGQSLRTSHGRQRLRRQSRHRLRTSRKWCAGMARPGTGSSEGIRGVFGGKSLMYRWFSRVSRCQFCQRSLGSSKVPITLGTPNPTVRFCFSPHRNAPSPGCHERPMD